MRSESDLLRLVGLHPPEKVITMTLWRIDNRLEMIKIKLGKWPVRDDAGIIETNPRYRPWRGLSVDYSTARIQFIDTIPIDSGRVLVTKVVEDSPSHAARLQPGNFISHVNDIAIQSPAEFHAAVKAASGTVALTLTDSGAMSEITSRVVLVHE